MPSGLNLSQIVLKERRFDIKLDREIARSDGLYIPFDIVINLHFLDIIEVVHDE